MRTGPKPIPRNLRVIMGTKEHPGRGGAPADPVPEPPVRIPEPPDYLTAREIDVFVSMARKLAGMRVMTEADVEALVIYCRNWLVAIDAYAKIMEVGYLVKTTKGTPMENPYLPIARKAEAVCMRVIAEFGLTPSSRNRVSR